MFDHTLLASFKGDGPANTGPAECGDTLRFFNPDATCCDDCGHSGVESYDVNGGSMEPFIPVEAEQVGDSVEQGLIRAAMPPTQQGGMGGAPPPPGPPPLPDDLDPLPPFLTNDWQWNPLGDVLIGFPGFHGGDVHPPIIGGPFLHPQGLGTPMPWCPPAIDFSQRDPNLERDGWAQHLVFVPNGQWHEKLIVMLPGNAGNPNGVRRVLAAYAQAGFRTVALRWNDAPNRANRSTRDYCGNFLGNMGDDTAMETCIETERNRKFRDEFRARLEATLVGLRDRAQQDPTKDFGFDEFLTQADEIDWSKLVLAGYSEGANQTAYNIRQPGVDVAGVILISGGGDPIQPNNQAEDLAMWMDAPHNVPADRMYALRHVDENQDYSARWTRSGVHEVPVDEDLDYPNPNHMNYANAHRLEHVLPGLTFAEAHESTVGDEMLFPAHMYMACKAGYP